ncbi:TlpA family protein disulfide reductase [Sphingobacterium chungjuense]|uniref:TlpA family protein disulfide reductase n=1 Tax=Sphingobacterium chungjuense TaxID=2675553 RepID=UPI0019D2A444|nr:TlpA family protein disulfide reductase [Sphingobacterium chungjuense]
MTFSNALAALWPKSKYTSKALPLYIFLILSSYVFVNSAFSQSRSDGEAGVKAKEVSPFIMGEKVPEEFWNQKHLFYHQGDTIRGTLEQFKGKLVLLDFWASWCGACRSSFPKLDSLQYQYPHDLAIILVNPARYKDTFKKIDRCYNEVLVEIGGAELPSIILDETLIDQFPHKLIPNYVWISKGGFIRGFTGSGGVLSQTIEHQINQHSL